jgi:predicted HNH restriction endonuclease
MLAAYEALINLGGTTPSDALMAEAQSSDIVESRTYVLSRRIERAANVRKKVLEIKGAICEGCTLDPIMHYNFTGPLANTPLDVHHAKPLFGLAEGESRRYKIPQDFLVLCPTCHRVIHKQEDIADLERLRNQVSFDRVLRK